MEKEVYRINWWQAITLIVLLLVVFAFQGWLLSILWNWVIVELFAAPVISVGKAMGLILISEILIGYPIKEVLISQTRKYEIE